MTRLRGELHPSVASDEHDAAPGAHHRDDERGLLTLDLGRDRAVRRFGAAIAPFAILVVGSRLLWRNVPWGVTLNGAELGLLSALIAVGLALTYRANRIINFAQADLGIVPSLLAALLILGKGWNYWFAMPLGLVAAAVLGALV